ncbi:hypothetical protein BS333_15045 [Vibrio azureus]|nr:hypothetical protein BS333_15045 [Vibrio azureus]
MIEVTIALWNSTSLEFWVCTPIVAIPVVIGIVPDFFIVFWVSRCMVNQIFFIEILSVFIDETNNCDNIFAKKLQDIRRSE